MTFNLLNYINESRSNLESLFTREFEDNFASAGDYMVDSLSHGGSILVAGNGGSHSDAQHFSGELVNKFSREHKALRVLTLGTNTSVATAWSNDFDFESQFSREVQAYGDKDSVFFGITTSGKSQNISIALAEAKKIGMKTIVLTSYAGQEALKPAADIVLSVPGDRTNKIQESHIVVYHALCIYIESKLPNWLL